jgi:hypothetical protein
MGKEVAGHGIESIAGRMSNAPASGDELILARVAWHHRGRQTTEIKRQAENKENKSDKGARPLHTWPQTPSAPMPVAGTGIGVVTNR